MNRRSEVSNMIGGRSPVFRLRPWRVAVLLVARAFPLALAILANYQHRCLFVIVRKASCRLAVSTAVLSNQCLRELIGAEMSLRNEGFHQARAGTRHRASSEVLLGV